MTASLGNMEVQRADLETELAWKDGKIYFKDASIQSIMRQVSRWYNIEVDYKGRIPQRTFNGGIYRSSTLNTLLKLLEQNDIHFSISQLPNGTKKLTVMP